MYCPVTEWLLGKYVKIWYCKIFAIKSNQFKILVVGKTKTQAKLYKPIKQYLPIPVRSNHIINNFVSPNPVNMNDAFVLVLAPSIRGGGHKGLGQ